MQPATMRRMVLAASAALVLAGAGPASAQYYGGDDYGPPRRFERDRDFDRRGDFDRRDYERRRDFERRGDFGDDRFDRRGPPPGRIGSLCTTSLGNCYTRPAPYMSRCGCDIPGHGFKHGAIGR